MYGLESINIQCPFCWETFEVIADCSVESQEYVEDCEVCCRPIVMKVEIDSEGMPNIEVSRES